MTDFHLQIKDWYRLNKRDLPWRHTNDPYKIWLSEVILQQTRVDQGLSYYLKFTQNYPSIEDLANASEEEVLRNWQGLGYYSRARNMHATAKQILNDFSGEFPNNYSEIKALKGIGDYTAAAMSSIAFDLPHAVVDGNVYRVLSRYFDLETPIDSNAGKKSFSDLAQQLLNENDPAQHNQAIMELGALVCTPKNPSCTTCPLNRQCLAFANSTIELRPVKTKKTKVRERYFHYFIFDSGQEVVLEKRTQKDIWQHLFQFPLHESPGDLDHEEITQLAGLPSVKKSEPITHILSHQRITARFHHFNLIPLNKIEQGLIVSKNELDDYALPRLIDRYLQENGW